MSGCGGCAPASGFPDPNRRSGSGSSIPVNAGSLNRQPRRRRFYSQHLSRVTDVVQDPRRITLRELTALLLLAYALYRGYIHADNLYELAGRSSVATVFPPRATLLQCNWMLLMMSLMTAYKWAADVVPWGVAAAVAVFFAEEALMAARRRRT